MTEKAGSPTAGLESLPVYPHLDEITSSLLSRKIMAVHAGTGAGKSTLIPWHFLSRGIFSPGKILMLEPRRVAARAVAERIAFLLGERPGETVGYRTRTETVIGKATLLEVVTEGVFVRVIQDSGYLEGYSLVIFDEFHERTIPGDLSFALAVDCRAKLRPDLCLLVMSATMPGDVINEGEIPLVEIPGRSFDVDVGYRPRKRDVSLPYHVARCVEEAMTSGPRGDVLVFLPGYAEINRTREALGEEGCDAAICILHGTMGLDEQRRVLSPSDERRVILSTNVAETSVTIPGVTAVVDSGLERRVRFLPGTGMDHRDTVRISAASASQRTGRAGRTGPGFCFRLWEESERLEESSPPAILEGDLAPLVLECAQWGAAPGDLPWITRPAGASLNAATELLVSLGLLAGKGITRMGQRALSLGLHPRLGSMMMRAESAGWSVTAALVSALVTEGGRPGKETVLFDEGMADWICWARSGTGHSPVMSRVDFEARRVLRAIGGDANSLTPVAVDVSLTGPLLSWAFPDRVAARRGDNRWVLSTGRGARTTGSFPAADFCVITDMDGGRTEGRIFRASTVSRADAERLFADDAVEICDISWDGWVPRGRWIVKAGGLILRERPAGGIDPVLLRDSVIAMLRNEGIASLPWKGRNEEFISRCRFLVRRGSLVGVDFSTEAMERDVEHWLLPFTRQDGGPLFDESALKSALEFRLGYENLPIIQTLAPGFIVLPSGNRKAVDYLSGDIPVVAARLQEFFGCDRTPEIAGEPVLLHLLSPSGRPVQITRDLGGFWDRSYGDVKKELKGRYPKHYWPDDPLGAVATARVRPLNTGK